MPALDIGELLWDLRTPARRPKLRTRYKRLGLHRIDAV